MLRAGSCLECLERCPRTVVSVSPHIVRVPLDAGLKHGQMKQHRSLEARSFTFTVGARSSRWTPRHIRALAAFSSATQHLYFALDSRDDDMHDPFCRPREALRQLSQDWRWPASMQHHDSRCAPLQSARLPGSCLPHLCEGARVAGQQSLTVYEGCNCTSKVRYTDAISGAGIFRRLMMHCKSRPAFDAYSLTCGVAGHRAIREPSMICENV